jgi:mRNA interferase MazF
MFKPGEIVIAQFPFTDLSSIKRRPCVVLGICDRKDDFIVGMVTSSALPKTFPNAVVVDSTHLLWKQTGFKVDSTIRCDKLAAINQSIISGAIGVLPTDVLDEVRRRLKSLFSIT